MPTMPTMLVLYLYYAYYACTMPIYNHPFRSTLAHQLPFVSSIWDVMLLPASTGPLTFAAFCHEYLL